MTIFGKIKEEVKNIAKSRREMITPSPMEVDQVTTWGTWPGAWEGEWGDKTEKEEDCSDDKRGEEMGIHYIGKAGARRAARVFRDGAIFAASSGTHNGIAARAKGRQKDTARTTTKGSARTKGTAKTGTWARGSARTVFTAKVKVEITVRAGCREHALGADRPSTF